MLWCRRDERYVATAFLYLALRVGKCVRVLRVTIIATLSTHSRFAITTKKMNSILCFHLL